MTPEEKAKERLARFQEAKKRAEEEKNSHGGYVKEDLPEFKCCVLTKEQPKVIRLIGNSPLMRQVKSDPLIVKRSMCIDDDGHYCTIILSDDRDNLINKLFRTIIGKYKYDKETKTKTYENANKPSFQRFMTNGKSKDQISAYERGMQPDTYYLFNCLDKSDDWCEKNKHTKLLCWDSTSKEVDGEKRTYYTYGVKPSLYNAIFDVQCTKLNRMFDQFDVVVKRLKEKLGDSYLTILNGDEKTAIEGMGLDPSKVSMEYLTDSEEAYERYDLEDLAFISRPTSYSYFGKVFAKLIKQTDIDFGTNFQSEFAEAIEKEKAEFAKRNAEKANSESKSEDTSTEVESEDEEVEESTTTIPSFDTMNKVEESSDDELPSEVEENPTPTVQKVAKVAKVTKFDPLTLKDKLPFIDKLKESDLKLIVGYDYDNDKLKFVEGTELADCPCGFELADAFGSCPKCGVSFE